MFLCSSSSGGGSRSLNKENNVFKDAIGVKGLRFKLYGNHHGNHGYHYGNYHDNHGNHHGNHGKYHGNQHGLLSRDYPSR